MTRLERFYIKGVLFPLPFVSVTEEKGEEERRMEM
jgi:hypothetical protein